MTKIAYLVSKRNWFGKHHTRLGPAFQLILQFFENLLQTDPENSLTTNSPTGPICLRASGVYVGEILV